ncbi:uncharacterized protein LOC109859360 [Pseudomyrmex gracilis]|uniref:uncharacterized protein LOC109859360 n=1 Tax=Pseudomyrmex gracilis TaxID=219809 RepID=UPI000994B5F0|nr:uncharacterized protein LOC109859360 [Pseudomyrmex gracilis]XP_020293129.1 uncharacterized protein LOC109859360 [Pseudomyrmex gracilis]XP_020293130.1 uncharacterized protein LOC109859360 [Pseudomyrmex gracilis]XP_020293131.1 uncharacterized protein LOC109859360 [Pseudomyrmex gracilis]XP_020293133.1 uncharacterized protein LOC109859360 [Pseudomyrmex gracilis]XP_020293134.1 uncharacterized protein LOC109859360 [Pseudomyrmex gracilis]XP_020293135.1 uncharacterized protein LOC109859360 [Pseudo
MTDQMSIPLNSAANMDEDGDLMTKTLEQRKEAFKENEELMRETTKFVSEVIDTAAKEASKRKIQSEGAAAGEGSRLKGTDTIAGWNNRARGICTRILNALCPCFANHELFAWTPYRYRFTRP